LDRLGNLELSPDIWSEAKAMQRPLPDNDLMLIDQPKKAA
jgi:hypothetical protein|tara:strand:+ start:490 stop:609 length:120 start_codon:yes stop_codon:yes gene_type:complete